MIAERPLVLPARCDRALASGNHAERSDAFFAVNDLYVLPLIGFDLVTMGRIHRATVWGGLVILISQPLRLAISGTDAWLSLAHWAVALVT